MEENENIPVDFDAHWKEIISNLFEDFILFFLPEAHPLIDFNEPIEFLEQELHKLIADKVKKGKVINDKLVKVKLKDGQEQWILVHIEIQSSFDMDFSERMFTYFYRIYDKYKQKITAIAIYTVAKNPKKYNKFSYEFLGTKATYEFNSVKINSYSDEELLQSKNPFAIAVLANKYVLKSKGDNDKRYTYKRQVFRLAIERNLTKAQIVNLFRFMNFVLLLPNNLELKFEREVFEEYIKPKDMTQPTKSSIRFLNNMYLALYGETLEERAKREEREKAALEKISIVNKLIKNTDLSDEEIAEICNISVDLVNDIRKDQ